MFGLRVANDLQLHTLPDLLTAAPKSIVHGAPVSRGVDERPETAQ